MSPVDQTPQIEQISTPRQCAELAHVLADVWGFTERSGVASPDMLRALAHSGGYLSGVRVGDELVGGSYGWPTNCRGEWRLHSHVVGFLPEFRAVGLGAQVKHHQRTWAGDTGFAAVEWTFDPLHALNARFNLAKLGARVESFHHNFYGEMDDAFHTGLPSDRFVVRWGVDDQPPVVPVRDSHSILSIGATQRPVIGERGAGLLRAEIPFDIVALRHTNNDIARAWTEAFAGTVGVAMQSGARVLAMDFGTDERPAYVLEMANGD
jgi:predicted GNAT superfamily acetyltransferase